MARACSMLLLWRRVARRLANCSLHTVRWLNLDALVGLDATRRIGKLFPVLCIVLFLQQGPLRRGIAACLTVQVNPMV